MRLAAENECLQPDACLSWLQRKSKLAALLRSNGDEDADGVALDRLLHGQNVIGKTRKDRLH